LIEVPSSGQNRIVSTDELARIAKAEAEAILFWQMGPREPDLELEKRQHDWRHVEQAMNFINRAFNTQSGGDNFTNM
jgi:hypothetical protein